jgi:hypothetical protein
LIFNGGVCPVKWQSISEIVRAFVAKDKPNHALVALALVIAAPLMALIAALVLL